MEHLLLKAAVTAATDKGEFEAVISTATIDRERDIVDPAGFVRALQKWVPLGKNIPLAWNHSSKPEDQIGYIDPATARVANGEVLAKGKIDLDSAVGKEAWRMVKMGTLGFSFGYLVPTGGSTPRKGGGRHIKELDVFEVTATPAPMNGDTRVLGWKALKQAMAMPDGSTMDAPEDDANECLGMMISMAQAFINDEDDPEDVAAMQSIMTSLLRLQGVEAAEEPDDGKALRERAEKLTAEILAEGLPEADGKAKSDMPAGAEWLFPEPELKAARDGDLKAVWTTAAVNDLPDSSFLYVEGGGDKDSEGKTTPRSLRHFPYKDAGGAVDLPHLRNALARIPQSSLSQDVKDRLTAKAQRILDEQKSVDATGKETKSRSVDPLRAKADALILEFASDGESLRRPPHEKAAPEPGPEFTPERVREIEREFTLLALTGDTEQ